MAQTVKNLPAMHETQIQSLVGKIPWRRERPPAPVFLPEEFSGQRSLAGYIPWDLKELDTTEQLSLSISRLNNSRVQRQKQKERKTETHRQGERCLQDASHSGPLQFKTVTIS